MFRYSNVQNHINSVGWVLLIISLVTNNRPIAGVACCCFGLVLILSAIAVCQVYRELVKKGGG